MYSNEVENDKYNDNGVLSQFLLCLKNEQFSYEEYSSEEKNINKIEKFFLNNDKEKSTINITNNKNIIKLQVYKYCFLKKNIIILFYNKNKYIFDSIIM